MSPAKNNREASTGRILLVSLASVLAVVTIAFAYWAWTATPKLQPSDEVYTSLDALFTAVTAHKSPMVETSATRLDALHREGKIPDPAWKRITRVIDLAKDGQWESSAKSLYQFIERQNH